MTPTDPRDEIARRVRDATRWGDAHRPAVLISSLLFVAVVGLVDNLTGQLVSPNLFYVLPVVAATAAVGRRGGLLVVVMVTIVGFLASYIDVDRLDAAVIGWNLMARATFLTGATWLVEALRHTLDQLEELATTDPMTGSLNRRAFAERAAAEITRSQRTGAPLSLVYLDVDGLKRVNDEEGHDAGDALIIRFAEAIRTHLRSVDLFARLGGDEFCLLLVEVAPPATAEVVQRLFAELETDGIRASAGVVAVDLSTTDVEGSLQRADAVMYRAKADHLGVLLEP